jgi:hypothetical protein
VITTVTTTTTTVTVTMAGSLALIAILTLLALLVKKEIIGGIGGERAKQWSRALNVAIVPLAVVFLAGVAVKIADILQ